MLDINNNMSNEVLFVLENKLNLKLGEDFILPDEEGNQEGSHINWTKSKSQLCYINRHRLSHYDLENYDDLYDIQKRFSGEACTTTTPKFRKVFAKCGIKLSPHAESKLDAYFASLSIKSYEIIDKPSEIYSLNSGYESSGSLGHSCMQGKSSDFFEMYDEEPCFKLLVAKNHVDDVIGRSLLVYEGDKIFMDRRYGSNDNIEKAIKEYGLKQGWFVKSNNNYNDIGSWEHSGDIGHHRHVSLNIDIEKYQCFPYMDTFKYACISDNSLSTTSDSSSSITHLTSTSGGPNLEERSECDECGSTCHDDDITTCYRGGRELDICESCRDDEYTSCYVCEHHSHNDEVYNVEGDYVCDDCISDNCTKCDECDEYAHDGNIYHYSNCDINLCDDCR